MIVADDKELDRTLFHLQLVECCSPLGMESPTVYAYNLPLHISWHSAPEQLTRKSVWKFNTLIPHTENLFLQLWIKVE